MEESILKTIKQHLGVYDEDTSFDQQIIDDINLTLNVLGQIGVRPEEGFQITGYDETWSSFLSDNGMLNLVKPYVFRKTQMLFDPPQSGILVNEYNKQLDEMEWRINAAVEYDIPEEKDSFDETITKGW